MGRALKQQETVRTNVVPNSVCRINVPAVRFRTLWATYPSSRPYVDPKTGEPPKGYENQCAIKVSAALRGAGVEMKSYRGASVSLDGKKAAVRAEELAAWFRKQPFCGLPQQPETITGKDWETKIKGRTGIIYFADYWARDGETTHTTGDHIDLWDGKGLTPNAANRLRRWGVNSLRWLPGPLGRFNFSDLADSREILFWEVQ